MVSQGLTNESRRRLTAMIRGLTAIARRTGWRRRVARRGSQVLVANTIGSRL
jgi:hypothetical protein